MNTTHHTAGKRFLVRLLPVFALALAIRVLCAIPALTEPSRLSRPDTETYLPPAYALAEDGAINTEPQYEPGVIDCVVDRAHPAVQRPPGYIVFLAGLRLIFGRSPAAFALAGCLIGALTVFPVGLAGLHLAGRRAGFWAAILYALNLTSLAAAPLILSDTLLGFLVAFQAMFLVRALRTGLENGYVVASETCALSLIGAEFIRDVEPGELLVINADGVHSHHFSSERKHRMCSMEYIYFARPDSVIEGCCVHTFRKRSGALLYEECPTKADLVTYVPESGMSAAIGYSEAGKIPLQMGLLKNMYVARTFIQPTQAMRNLGVRMKLSPMRSIVKDKSVVVVDDSIVRGTTSKQLVQMLRDAGAREVHMRIASPKYAWPCFYGIDTGTRDQLIAARMSEQEICEFIGADSLYYLSEEALFKASERKELCTACFGGGYPTDLYGYSEEKE